MKNTYLFILLILSIIEMTQAQTKSPLENVVITYNKNKTEVSSNKNGELIVNVSPKDIVKFKANGLVHYSDFGAKGDGKTDDIDAIAATHAFANQNNLKVQADERTTYYISGKQRTAVIQTDTDFKTANFIIDDSNVQNRMASIFMVSSSLEKFKPMGISSLKRNQENITITFPKPCILTVKNSNRMQYIRFGKNQNNGYPQTDIFIVDRNGNIDKNTPIISDFDQITDIEALPIDENTITIQGGFFTTIANKQESKYNYFRRNIAIRRSNVIVDGLEHRITGEGEQGAPYSGFINVSECANVIVKNCTFTGHKTYTTIGNAGVSVSMGTYDFQVNSAMNVSFINCKQTNDIKDNKYWGIMSSNSSKNLSYDNCTLSRFDAHMGVVNASIRNSTLGHAGINAIGFGTLTVENSTIYGRCLVNLREDYGSTWQGEFIFRNCVFVPTRSKEDHNDILFGGYYSGQHDFGYKCYMPERIIIENLYINDANRPENYKGISIFDNFNPEMTKESYKEIYPYFKTKEVILKNVTTASGKPLRISNNTYMFRDVKIINN